MAKQKRCNQITTKNGRSLLLQSSDERGATDAGYGSEQNCPLLKKYKIEGYFYRKRRPADIEPVFANLKPNKTSSTFMLKGIDKVEIETGLLSLAHNLAKMDA